MNDYATMSLMHLNWCDGTGTFNYEICEFFVTENSNLFYVLGCWITSVTGGYCPGGHQPLHGRANPVDEGMNMRNSTTGTNLFWIKLKNINFCDICFQEPTEYRSNVIVSTVHWFLSSILKRKLYCPATWGGWSPGFFRWGGDFWSGDRDYGAVTETRRLLHRWRTLLHQWGRLPHGYLVLSTSLLSVSSSLPTVASISLPAVVSILLPWWPPSACPRWSPSASCRRSPSASCNRSPSASCQQSPSVSCRWSPSASDGHPGSVGCVSGLNVSKKYFRIGKLWQRIVPRVWGRIPVNPWRPRGVLLVNLNF